MSLKVRGKQRWSCRRIPSSLPRIARLKMGSVEAEDTEMTSTSLAHREGAIAKVYNFRCNARPSIFGRVLTLSIEGSWWNSSHSPPTLDQPRRCYPTRKYLERGSYVSYLDIRYHNPPISEFRNVVVLVVRKLTMQEA